MLQNYVRSRAADFNEQIGYFFQSIKIWTGKWRHLHANKLRASVRTGINGMHISSGVLDRHQTQYIVLRDHDGTLERWMRRPSRKVGQSLISNRSLTL